MKIVSVRRIALIALWLMAGSASAQTDVVRDALERVCATQWSAHDDELPGLVQRVLDGELTKRKEVKAAVKNWRPDHQRV